IVLTDRLVVDARVTHAHQPVGIELPVLVAERAKPVSGVIVPLVSEADSDAIVTERPQLLDEPIVQLPVPLASKERDNGFSAHEELRAVAPPALHAVCECHALRVTRVPAVLRRPNFLNGGFERERWHRWAGFGVGAHVIDECCHGRNLLAIGGRSTDKRYAAGSEALWPPRQRPGANDPADAITSCRRHDGM